MKLNELKNTHRKDPRSKRVGRGNSSQRGKTCCRGHKGDKSRSGYKTRAGKEGGQLPLFQKLPYRGFSNHRFKARIFAVTLERLNAVYSDGEIVSLRTLAEKGFPVRRMKDGFKVLSTGELTKKVVVEANYYTKGALKKLEEKGIEFKRVQNQ